MCVKNSLLIPVVNAITYLPIKCYRLSLSLIAIIKNCLYWKRDSTIALVDRKITIRQEAGSGLGNVVQNKILPKNPAEMEGDNQIKDGMQVKLNEQTEEAEVIQPIEKQADFKPFDLIFRKLYGGVYTRVTIKRPLNESWDNIKIALQYQTEEFILFVPGVKYDKTKWESESHKDLYDKIMKGHCIEFTIQE